MLLVVKVSIAALSIYVGWTAHVGRSFHVAVDSADFDVLGHKEHLFTMSPEEASHSVLFTIATSITTLVPHMSHSPVCEDEGEV